MPCNALPPGTEAGRSTDFNILVHLDRIGDSRLTPMLCPWLSGRQNGMGYVENRGQGPLSRGFGSHGHILGASVHRCCPRTPSTVPPHTDAHHHGSQAQRQEQ
ncbi:MAG: hypothetical protein JWQ56_3937 [Pseudarthrobacter sp.]|nr:hypothetical protein [Pseudarthrobacter sp.]